MAPDLSLDDATVLALRSAGLGAPVELSDRVERTDHVVVDDPRVVVRVHRPRGVSGPLPAIVQIHGGGYVLGSYEMDDPRFDRWSPELGVIGVSVEYRLAPETPWPGPLEDCYAALVWTHAHAAELGIDPARIGIGGVSAGGGLAAALSLLARDRGEVPVAFQVLECPMIDDRRVTVSSQLDGLLVWSRESNAYGWRAYLGDLYGTDVHYTAAPARADDLSGLPPALVIVGGADGFRDEDITYAMRLSQAGVPTALHVIPGAPHGVQMFAGTAPAMQWERLVTDWVREQLA
ncbi:MAG: alpha/beta hydrolase [Acidimicrobiia bacterium]|nr:alpha/beta hydrolase [Acidimicrobiia bacterium]